MAKKTEDPRSASDPQKVRAYKINNDAMTSFCGEKVQIDQVTGKEYFELDPSLKPMVDVNINLQWPADEQPESE